MIPPIRRRQLLNVVIGFLVTLAAYLPTDAVASEPEKAGSGQTESRSNERPNILFIFSDDHAVDAIGAYGSTRNQTPNLDRIAREGMLFENSFCANSICGPSRACILTGKHSHINGFRRNGMRFDGSQWTFPKVLRDAGYQTALIGKWHLNSDPEGFDHWEVLPGQGHYYNPDFIQMDGTKIRQDGYVTDIITDKTIDWLQQRKSDQPFMLMCQHKAPHRNWCPPPRYYHQYDDVIMPAPASLRDDYARRTELLKENEMSIRKHFSWSHDMKLAGPNQFPEHFSGRHKNQSYARMTDEQRRKWDEAYQPKNQAFIKAVENGEMDDEAILMWKYQRYIKDYLRCVQAVDDSVGQLLGYLDDHNLADNTIVIYSSDQGFYLGEHGWYDKRWMFEESLKMPLMVRWPERIDAGVRSTALVQNIDYAPTFLEVAGLPAPDAVQGRSLIPIIDNDGAATSDWRDAIYYAYYENGAVHNVPIHDGVRTERYKLMFFPRTKEFQLFDLQVDPYEMRSFHDDDSYAEIFEGMRQRLADLRGYYDVNTATIPATRADEGWWAKRETELKRRAKNSDARVVFVGDSITQGWEGRGQTVWDNAIAPMNALNLGISGDRTEHVLWRLDHGGFGGADPDAVVVMIGTNNTGHLMQDPDEVAEGIEAIVDRIEALAPKATVILQAILPRGGGVHDPKRLNNDAINRRIRRLASRENVQFVDLANAFMKDDGSLDPAIMPDQLHLSPRGYQIWADQLVPLLSPMVASDD